MVKIVFIGHLSYDILDLTQLIKANSLKSGDAKPTDLKLKRYGGWVAGGFLAYHCFMVTKNIT
jgi:hypothetical protein